MQRRIGLTGGIASGKAVWAGCSKRGDGPCSMRTNTPGPCWTQAAKAANRFCNGTHRCDAMTARSTVAALGRIVFSDAQERTWLNDLIHPQVRARFERGLQEHASAPTIVLMIPLLFEAGLTGLCTEIWLVDCDEEQQLQRMRQRDGLSDADARARMAAQWPLSQKRPLADVVIDNRGTPTS